MFKTQNQQIIYTRRNLGIWFLLAFQAGAINIGGFLACHRFVTHVTGFATFFGADVSHGEYLNALGLLSVPLFFVIGAMISASLTDRETHLQRSPKYSFVMFLVFFNLVLAFLGGVLGLYGTFGKPLDLFADYSLLALLCLSSGLQNAVITSASGAVVRTTHLTGITTDLGIGLVRLFALPKSHPLWFKEVQYNFMRFGTITSFLLGSCIAGLIFVKLQYWGFMVPVGTSFFIWRFTLHIEKTKSSQQPFQTLAS